MNRAVRVDGVMFSRGSEGVVRTGARTVCIRTRPTGGLKEVSGLHDNLCMPIAILSPGCSYSKFNSATSREVL